MVLWGEPVRYTEELQEALGQADVLLLIGASGDVTDIEHMAETMKRRGKAVVEVNPRPSAATPHVDIFIKEKSDDVVPLIASKVARTKSLSST